MDHQKFLEAFESATLTKAEWTHEAHILMGWLYVQHYGNWERALPVVRAGIQKLNAAINHGVGYHETITVVFLRVIDSYWKESCETDWEKFKQTYPELFNYRKPILAKYYTKARIFSEEARLQFIEPDREPLPS
jgi:hypothetical protein